MKLRITDMNSNRRATRDLLLEYDSTIMPPHPRVAGRMPSGPSQTHMIYPWENTNLGILSAQLYVIAVNSGFNGSQEEFNNYFGYYIQNNDKEIIFDTYNNFPQVGSQNMLYFDLNEKIFSSRKSTRFKILLG